MTIPPAPMCCKVHICNQRLGWLGRNDSLTDYGITLTRYLSDATLTKMRSSPTRTFSPSDLCLDAGWIVHQHDSPLKHWAVHLLINGETARTENLWSVGLRMHTFRSNCKTNIKGQFVTWGWLSGQARQILEYKNLLLLRNAHGLAVKRDGITEE